MFSHERANGARVPSCSAQTAVDDAGGPGLQNEIRVAKKRLGPPGLKDDEDFPAEQVQVRGEGQNGWKANKTNIVAATAQHPTTNTILPVELGAKAKQTEAAERIKHLSGPLQLTAGKHR